VYGDDQAARTILNNQLEGRMKKIMKKIPKFQMMVSSFKYVTPTLTYVHYKVKMFVIFEIA
jgi:hypothetical protein